MLTAAPFPPVNTGKPPRGPLTDECIKKPWYIYTIEYYIAIGKNKIMPSAATWMQPGITIPSEIRRQTNTTNITSR